MLSFSVYVASVSTNLVHSRIHQIRTYTATYSYDNYQKSEEERKQLLNLLHLP